jgi:hypothetical protein|tara:strand:- start:1356 stop:2960 length:1605 start_codon:yes stop_codon:yes gene_type:complete
MATEEINIKVKSDLGEVSQDAADAASEFEVMGVSLKSIKAGFKTMAATAKASFATVRAGMMSTGIGALVVAVGALIAYFTDTKKGSEALKRTMAGLGAVVKVLNNLFAQVGGTIVGAFKDPKQAIEDLWEGIKTNLMNRLTGIIDGFKAVGKVIHGVFTMDWDKVAEGAKDYGHAIVQIATGYDTAAQQEFLDNIMDINENLGKAFEAETKRTGALQRLTDAQRDLNVETAESIAWIEKQKLIAEDITKSYEEREKAATKAFNKEKSLENKRIELAATAVRLEKERHALLGEDGTMAEDLDRLAELEIHLANVRQESAGRQISLQNFLNGLREQEEAAKQAAREKEEAADDAMWAKKIADNEKWNQEQDKNYKKSIDLAKREAKEKEDLDKFVQQEKMKTITMGFAVAGSLAKEGSVAAKGIAVAQTIFNTQQGIMKALADVPYPMNIVQSALTGIMGAASIAKILSTDPSGGGASAGGGGGAAAAQAPAPQMMSGAFDLTGGIEPEATRAYVVTDEMSNSQNQLANIRRRATI